MIRTGSGIALALPHTPVGANRRRMGKPGLL